MGKEKRMPTNAKQHARGVIAIAGNPALLSIPPRNSARSRKGVCSRGDWQPEPFAVHLLGEYQRGKTVEQLSRDTGIPIERIEMRLKAATAHVQRAPGVFVSIRGGPKVA
jgi:hypothetical protein